MKNFQRIRAFLEQRLAYRGDFQPFADDESLFVSGRLDSLDVMHTVMFMEGEFAVDFAELDFTIDLVDRPLDLLRLLPESQV